MEQREEGKRQSSLPISLIPHLYTGPQQRRNPSGEAAQLETTSEGGERTGRESPYASHPVPSYPVSHAGTLTLTPAAFEDDSERGSRCRSRSPEIQDVHRTRSPRQTEASFLTHPARPFRANTISSDLAYYSHTPYSVPAPSLREATWGQGEAGPSTYHTRQESREEAFQREARRLQYSSQYASQYAGPEHLPPPPRHLPGNLALQEESGHSHNYDDRRVFDPAYAARFGGGSTGTLEHSHPVTREAVAYRMSPCSTFSLHGLIFFCRGQDYSANETHFELSRSPNKWLRTPSST
ncbi:hypothetical protein BKA93DRAFT_288681 [Sparassis latifolia]